MAFLDIIKESLERVVRKTFKSTEEEINRLVSFHIKRHTSYILKQLMFFFIMAISILFLVLALVFFGIDYLHLGATLSFFIIGIILMTVSVIIKVMR